MSGIPASRVWLLPVGPSDPRAPTADEIRAAGVEITARFVEPEPVRDLESIRTYVYSHTWWGKDLCLATRWEPGDPMPFVCAREAGHVEAGDGLHVTAKASGSYYDGYPEQTSWREGE